MRKLSLLASTFLVAAAPGIAAAGGSAGSFGLGAEYMLDLGIGGVSLNYDGGMFHAGGAVGFNDGNDDFHVNGRFYYHLHATTLADFSLGGEVGFRTIEGMGPMGEGASQLFLQGGLQIRAFVATNVALSFSAGLIVGLVDADSIAVTGQPTGAAGVHYYFF